MVDLGDDAGGFVGETGFREPAVERVEIARGVALGRRGGGRDGDGAAPAAGAKPKTSASESVQTVTSARRLTPRAAAVKAQPWRALKRFCVLLMM